MTTRREWIAQSALAGAVVGLSPELRNVLGATPFLDNDRPYLELALRSARWIARSRQVSDHGDRYPADPLKPESVGFDFYNGMPGVVAFHAALASATADPAWLTAARAGADSLVHEATANGDSLDAGLYTGLGGVGFALDCVAAAGGGHQYSAAAARATDLIRRHARSTATGTQWSDSWDIISGVAGTGLYLLHAAAARDDRALLQLASDAGRRLLAVAEPGKDGGLMWYPAASFRRNYPNFSHGTAGVGYFLATLYQRTGEQAFFDGALEAAAYLGSIATRSNRAVKIFHQDEDGQNRFYLSWCHGPVGTARLFWRLHQITGEAKWSNWVDGLTNGVLDSGAPERRTDGYWNNVSQCCGNVGIGQYCIDLARYRRAATTGELLTRVVVDTQHRATSDDAGLRWIQAENRTQPENLVAQTGFMQGAAGAGVFFLQLDAFSRGKPWGFPQPDTPWTG